MPKYTKRAPDLVDRPPLADFKWSPAGDLFGLDVNGDLWMYVPKKSDRQGEIIRPASWRKLTRRALDATKPTPRKPRKVNHG